MKKRIASTIAIALILASTAASAASTQTPQAGSALPAMALLKPVNADELTYLGLSGTGSFSVDQVKAQAVIIQIFSMYCPYCQRDAPNVNRLFGLMENNPNLKGKIKIIGIGAGNSSFEVNTFKKKYKVEFPLIPDADFVVHKVLGQPRTPFIIVVKLSGPKKMEVVYIHLGAHDNIETFLADVIRLADVK